jgi:hypothetical protein
MTRNQFTALVDADVRRLVAAAQAAYLAQQMVVVCPYCDRMTDDEMINCCGEATHGIRMTLEEYENGNY